MIVAPLSFSGHFQTKFHIRQVFFFKSLKLYDMQTTIKLPIIRSNRVLKFQRTNIEKWANIRIQISRQRGG